MTTFRLNFAGFVTKAEHRNAGSKPIIELSICKKNKVKEGEPEAYTWIKVTCWDVPQFMADKLVKGAFVAGSGDMKLRSYMNKDGAKAVSCEVQLYRVGLGMRDTGRRDDAGRYGAGSYSASRGPDR